MSGGARKSGIIRKALNRVLRPNPARELALIGARQRKAASRKLIRDTVDQMNRNAGRPPVQWPEAR